MHCDSKLNQNTIIKPSTVLINTTLELATRELDQTTTTTLVPAADERAKCLSFTAPRLQETSLVRKIHVS